MNGLNSSALLDLKRGIATESLMSLSKQKNQFEIDKTRGARRGKADCRFHRLCPHIWAESGEMNGKFFIWSFVQLVIIWFAERPI